MSLETAFCENTAAALRCGQHPQEGGREQKLNSLSLAWSGFAQVGKDYKVHFADRLPEALGRALALVQKLLHGNILFPNSQMSKFGFGQRFVTCVQPLLWDPSGTQTLLFVLVFKGGSRQPTPEQANLQS